MSFASRVDNFTRRYPRTGYPLAVAYKFFDDQGGYLAALITYYAFVSLFPALLLFTTILGWVLRNNEGLRDRIVNSALDQIPVIGDQFADPAALSGGPAAIIIGLVGALYGGLGVAVASQNAMNIIWAVPRNSRPNPILVRIRGFVLLFTVGLSMIGLVAIGITSAAIDFGRISQLITDIGQVVLALAVFLFAFRYGTVRTLRIIDVLPGAAVAAVGWQLLQRFGGVYVERVITRASVVNSVFATVLGLIAFLYLAAALIVFCMEMNAVRTDKLYPRSLLTPFTDNVVLTEGDVRFYTNSAKAQRNKGFEVIDVSFDKTDPT
ncbi:MAG: YihY/virulence factor BrkB family protein [Gordonia sp. (in: high G+C Gram-positive bacteria)]|uniref:YihY/virulence factor BrkB family protein n=1 Tax=Gordonia sp. (in: high G+C Gram-positive bacteria) TaxID=84139 RepID=UPI003BB79E88